MSTLRFQELEATSVVGDPTPGHARFEVQIEEGLFPPELVYSPISSRTSFLRHAERAAREDSDPIAFRAARTDVARREDGIIFRVRRPNDEMHVTFEAYRLEWAGFSRFYWRICCRHERIPLEPSQEESSLEGGKLVFCVTPGVYRLYRLRYIRNHLQSTGLAAQVTKDGQILVIRDEWHDLDKILAKEAGIDFERERADTERQIAEATLAARDVEARLTPFGDRALDLRWQTMERRWFALDCSNWFWFAERIRDVSAWESSSSVDHRTMVAEWVRQNANEETITRLAHARVDDLADEGEPLHVTPHMVDLWERYHDAAVYVVQSCERARQRGVELLFPYPSFPEQLYEVADREIRRTLPTSSPFSPPWSGVAPRPRGHS